MKKVNLLGLNPKSLSDIVDNSKSVFNDELGLGLSLNQVRSKVAKQFGAKSWAGLVAASEAAQKNPKSIIADRITQSGEKTTYSGENMAEVCKKIVADIDMKVLENMVLEAQEEYSILPGLGFDDFDLSEFLTEMSISEDSNHHLELFTQIKAMADNDESELNKVVSLFSHEELVRYYFERSESEIIKFKQDTGTLEQIWK